MTNCCQSKYCQPERKAHTEIRDWAKRPQRSARASVLPFLVSALGLALGAASVQGQTPQLNSVNDQTQTPIPGVGHDYQHLLGETVNFSNGSVSFKMSFPVPKGRGLTLPLAWSYNSGAVNPLDTENGITPIWDYTVMHQWPQKDGWDLAEGIPFATVQIWSVSPPANSNYNSVPCNYQSGMTFTDMSGTMHNLGTGALATTSTVSSGTTVFICQGTVATLPPNGDGQVLGTLYSATAANDLASNSPSSGGFAVTDKSGTVYLFGAGMASQSSPNGNFYPGLIEDRNGNQIGMSNSGNYLDTRGQIVQFPNGNDSDSPFTVDNITYTPSWSTISVNYQIQASGGASPGLGVGCQAFPTTVSGTRSALSLLALPNGQEYQFAYNSYGLLSEIIYPDGGWVKYTWQMPTGFNEMTSMPGTVVVSAVAGEPVVYGQSPFGCVWQYQTPVLATRQVSFDGTTVAQTQSFSYNTNWDYASGGLANDWNSKTTTVLTTDNKLGLTSSTLYTYTPVYPTSQPFSAGYNAQKIPVESQVVYSDWGQGLNPGPTLKTVTKTWRDQFNMTSETTTIHATNRTSQTVYTYANNLCGTPASNSFVYPQEQDDYDFGNGAAGPLSKRTIYKYWCSAPANIATYLPTVGSSQTNPAQNFPLTLPPLVYAVIVENGLGQIQAATQYQYDQTPLTTVSATQHDSSFYGTPTYTAAMTTRGNVTSVTKCSPAPTSVPSALTLTSPICTTGPTVTYAYDITGQPASMTDACGNSSCSDMSSGSHTTTFSFADSPSGGNFPGNSNAYLTNITYPTTPNGVTPQKKFQYSYVLGYISKSIDENGQTTSYFYNDLLNRPTQTIYPDGGEATIEYTDTAPNPTVTTSKRLNASGLWEASVATMDGMEHVIQTQLVSDPDGADTVLTTYDGEGRPYTVTNPFRTTPNGTTMHYYDALGRQIETQEQDGSLLQWCYDGQASTLPSPLSTVANCSSLRGSDNSSTSPGTIAGTWVDSTDENGNHWQYASDAFGRRTVVMEPNGGSQTPTMETDYAYDTLNDLLSVQQWGGVYNSLGARQRSFTYNSLAQLVTSFNPESGLISYVYDNNGNLTNKTSPAVNVSSGTQTISYCYDNLNRLTYKFYPGASVSCTSPSGYAASYSYDTSSLSGALNTVGKLTDEKAYMGGTLVAESSPYNFDPMGRLKGELQNPFGPAAIKYPFLYDYDLAGDVTCANNGFAQVTSSSDCLSNFTASASSILEQFTYDSAGRMATANTLLLPSAFTPASSYPSTLLQATALGSPAYDSMGHLINAQLGVASPGAPPAIQMTRQYDNRGRITSENDNAAASTSATGSVGVIDVSGVETAPYTAATSGTAILTTTGTDGWQAVCTTIYVPEGQYHVPTPVTTCTAVPATGALGVFVDGFMGTASYGPGTTDNTVAQELAASFNVSGSPVTAVQSGASVTLTATATGTASNYPLTFINNGGYFISDPNATLTGGQNPAPVYDAGTSTVTITNNSASYTTSPIGWGQGDTSSTVAGKLASAINSAAGSLVTATASGSSIRLVSNSVGAGTNYTVSASVADTQAASYPALFPIASFDVDATSMSGGSNESAGSGSTAYSYQASYAPNSNLASYSDLVMGNWNFGYDTLNRLITSHNTAVTSDSTQFANFNGCWSYDAFGNRLLEAMSTTACNSSPSLASWATYNATNNNRMDTTFQNSNQANGYDGAGDVTNDGVNQYLYDAEGRICAAWFTVSGTTAITGYLYDANGLRVGKGSLSSVPTSCPTPTTAGFTLNSQYLLGLGGEQVTELNGSGAPQHTNIFAGGTLATYDFTGAMGLHFALTDPLGTKRMQVSGTGTAEMYCRSLPFGNSLGDPRVPDCPGAPDATEHHFTGKERDTESGNDYFGARYYSSAMGRFMSPDWSAKAEPVPYAKLDNPQTLNLYAYVGNNPLVRIDADGHYYCTGNKTQCGQITAGIAAAQKALAGDKLTADQRGKLKGALDFLGTAKDMNGVVLKFDSKMANTEGANTDTKKVDTGNGSSMIVTTITFNANKLAGESSVAAGETAVHEATHGEDGAKRGRNPIFRSEELDTERNAYTNQQSVHQGLGLPNPFGPYMDNVEGMAQKSTEDFCKKGGAC